MKASQTDIFRWCTIVLLFTTSCRVDTEIRIRKPLGEQIPKGWPTPAYRFENNPITESKFELGRALFYEPMLSRDNSISCGSCHQQLSAFANLDHRVSHGIDQLEGTRNSPGLFNLTWHTSLMHDGGVNHLEVQPIAPITNVVEMDETLQNVLAKLRKSSRYDTLFARAYGSTEMTSEKMLKAIAQFMGLMYSFNSRYDQYKRGQTALSEQEHRGYAAFGKHCASCHSEPAFTDFKFRNNGLSVDPLVMDSGRARITLKQEDLWRFKTPSLRNVEVTMPYMHDGRYTTLEQCLDHYSTGVVNTTNLDLPEYGIQLKSGEKEDIIAFLRTLTDHEFLHDARFGDPNFE